MLSNTDYTNLENFIESPLDRTAEEYDDTTLYKHLCEERPEGKIMLNACEKKDFENWLSLNTK
jgi:hypothetical protein